MGLCMMDSSSCRGYTYYGAISAYYGAISTYYGAHDGEGEHARVERAGRLVEGLLLVAQPAEEEGAAEHQQQVGQDRAEQRDLHDAQQTRLDSEHRHDQLGHVAEGGVEQPAQPGTGKEVA